jgi:hypothetical protein
MYNPVFLPTQILKGTENSDGDGNSDGERKVRHTYGRTNKLTKSCSHLNKIGHFYKEKNHSPQYVGSDFALIYKRKNALIFLFNLYNFGVGRVFGSLIPFFFTYLDKND